MPTLTSTEPDSYDLDYYYSKYKNQPRYGFGMSEAKTTSLRVLPPDVEPTICETNSGKKLHYFHIPLQPKLATCLCQKFHTNFTSRYYQITHKTTLGQAPMETSPIISSKRFNKITEELTASPVTKQTTQPDLSNPKILFSNYHTDSTPAEIAPHSQHHHTCCLCKTKNISCQNTKTKTCSRLYSINNL